MNDDERERYRYLLYRAVNLMQGCCLVENRNEHPVVKNMRYQSLTGAMRDLTSDIEQALAIELPLEDAMRIGE